MTVTLVLRLVDEALASGELRGEVEEVRSGERLRVRDGAELLAFARTSRRDRRHRPRIRRRRDDREASCCRRARRRLARRSSAPPAKAGLGKAPPDLLKTSRLARASYEGRRRRDAGLARTSSASARSSRSRSSRSTREYGGVRSWQDPASSGATLLHCTGKQVHKKGDQWTADRGLGGSARCTYKATAPIARLADRPLRLQRPLRRARVGSTTTCWRSCRRASTTSPARSRASRTRAARRRASPIRGMTVGVFSDATKAGGGYAFSKKVQDEQHRLLGGAGAKTGGYDVLPYLREGDRKVKPQASLEPGTRAGARHRRRTTRRRTSSSTARSGSRAEIRNSAKGQRSTSARGRRPRRPGASSSRSTSPNDDPMPNMPVDLKVNTASAAVRRTRRSATRRRRHPLLARAGDVGARRSSPTGSKTDAKGQVAADVFFGTDPGTLRISASVPGQPRLYDAAEVHMKPDAPLGADPGVAREGAHGARSRAGLQRLLAQRQGDRDADDEPRRPRRGGRARSPSTSPGARQHGRRRVRADPGAGNGGTGTASRSGRAARSCRRRAAS